MPSYRLRVEIGAMKSGSHPTAVVPAAIAAVSDLVYVEANDIDIVGGAAFIQLRVTIEESSPAEEDDDARAALAAMKIGIEVHAATGRSYLLRRWPKGRWAPVLI